MNTRKCMGIKFGFIILCVLLGQRLTYGQSLTVGQEASVAGAAELAEYQNYLPLMIRQVFVESRGELDPSFDGDGLVLTDGQIHWDGITDLVLQDDGKIVVVGAVENGLTYDFAVLRYNQDGSLDSSFGVDGWATTDFGYHDQAYAVALQPDGKILVAGSASGTYPLLAGVEYLVHGDVALARYNPDGSLDESFGTGGKLLTDITFYDCGNDVVLQPDGKILVPATAASLDGEETYSIFALLRYNLDGSLDTSFDGDGLVTTDIYSMQDFASIVLLQPDSLNPGTTKILVLGGTGAYSYDTYFAMARYNVDGSLDASFGESGMLVKEELYTFNQWFAASMLPDGDFYLAASSSDAYYDNIDLALAHFNPDGSLDAGFGEGGMVTTDWGCSEYPTGVAVQPDVLNGSSGKIIVSGTVTCVTEDSVILARYAPDGSLDESFGYLGQVMTELGEESANALALQPDGKIVVGGRVDWNLALVRYK